jgi:hypothetical protein
VDYGSATCVLCCVARQSSARGWTLESCYLTLVANEVPRTREWWSGARRSFMIVGRSTLATLTRAEEDGGTALALCCAPSYASIVS